MSFICWAYEGYSFYIPENFGGSGRGFYFVVARSARSVLVIGVIAVGFAGVGARFEEIQSLLSLVSVTICSWSGRTMVEINSCIRSSIVASVLSEGGCCSAALFVREATWS